MNAPELYSMDRSQSGEFQQVPPAPSHEAGEADLGVSKEAAQMQDIPIKEEPSIGKEGSVSPHIGLRGHSEAIDLRKDSHEIFYISSDDDDPDLPPSIAEILDHKPIKREPKSPGRKRTFSPVVEDEEIVDDRSTYEATDSGDESSDGDDSSPMQDLKKRKKRGPRARTAREYHVRRNSKLSAAQRRNTAWKEERLEKLQKKLDKFIASKKPNKRRPKLKPQAKDFDAGQFFNNDTWSDKSSSGSGDDLDDGGRLRAKTRKGVWEEFETHYPHLDLSRSRIDNNDLVKSAASFGYGRVKRVENGWELQGMKSILRNHQLRCVSWMTKRECSLDEPHGGIVADVMGLGKTVQCLGVVVANPQKPELKVKATLIIVPSRLKSQWWFELNKHTPELTETSMVFNSKAIDNSITKMGQCDIVITTYGELIKSLPQPDAQTIRSWKKKKLDISEMTFEWTKENLDGAGLLHQMQWYRVVIDECHHIKNPETRLFRAAFFLEGECRWLLSGTPIMNRYEEFHPLLRFLREPLTANLAPRRFQRQFCDHEDIGSRQRLGILLSDLIIRRTIKDKIMGFPIIKLKPTHREVREMKRYLPERLLYRFMKDCLQELVGRSFKDDDERKKLSTPLPQVTRLRQLIANPDLIARQIMVVLDIEGMTGLKKKLKKTKFAAKAKPQARILLSRLDRWIVAKRLDAYKIEVKEDACAVCKQPDENFYKLKTCGCIICETCLANDESIEVQDNGEERGHCPKCKKAFIVEFDAEPYQPADSPSKGRSKTRREVRKGKDARGFRPTLSPGQKWPLQWLKDYDEDNNAEILPTAKLRGTILQIEAWLAEAPLDKIVVFTQFRFFAILVGIMLELKKVKFIYYTGDMPSSDRCNALQEIQTDPSIQVMIAGLKCGGTGLNFQFANRGIITDIWWNTCIDEQALGRFQRLGQEKSVYFVRIVVTKTVDSKLIKLQDTKKKAIASVVQDSGLNEDELADVLGYYDGEPDEEPDSEDDDEEHDSDGF